MSLFQCSFFSKTLCTMAKVMVSLPSPKSSEVLSMPLEQVHERKEKKVLYLLHGMFEDETIWLRKSNVERYAQEENVALIMPFGENNYYTDMAHGLRYFTFLTEELPMFMASTFALKPTRENTAIAGLSMGGYGACKAAFSRGDIYGAFASLSGPLDTVQLADLAEQAGMSYHVHNVFGQKKEIPNGNSDLFYLSRELLHTGNPLPRGYLACGTEDENCYPMHIKMKQHLEELGYPMTCKESHGGHEWEFWDREIQSVLQWLNQE